MTAKGGHHSDAAKRKMSKSHKGNRSKLGLKLSEETKIKISISKQNMSDETKKRIGEANANPSDETRMRMRNAHLGKLLSDATKKKLSAMRKGRMPWIKGKHHSEDSIRKMREAHTGIRPSDETREKLRICRAKKVIPYRDTTIERMAQSHINNLLIPYTKHNTVTELSSPYSHHQFDIVVGKILIEVQGCYWHGCVECFPTHSNIQKENVRRDKAIKQAVEASGYTVIWIWEHDINKGDFSAIDNVLAFKGLLNEPVSCDAMELPLEIITQ